MLPFHLLVKCAPGTYSSNGVEPCKPCPKGTYQAIEGKLSCIPCQGTRSTYGPGAKTISHCIGKTKTNILTIIEKMVVRE